MERPNKLLRELRRALGPDLKSAFRPDESLMDDEEWEKWFDRAVQRAVRLGKVVQRNRHRIAESYSDFEELPPGRQDVIWASSPPQMLMALARDLIESSYLFRFKDPKRSLRLAHLGLETTFRLEQAGLTAELLADLQAEALGYLANARRINADLTGAARALEQAEQTRKAGTGDRHLKADLLNFRATFEFSKGNARHAAALLERGIRLWRLLQQPERLGQALLDRAIVACWIDPCGVAEDLIVEAMSHTADPLRSILALNALAERLARDGDGTSAWRAVCSRDVLILETGIAEMSLDGLLRRCKWATGLAYRSLGEQDRAAEQLEEVRGEYLRDKAPRLSALVSLDLAALYAAQGEHARVKQLAEEAYETFRSESLEQRALAAFQVLYEAARAEEATAELAIRVANFVVRSQYDKTLSFHS